MKIVLGINIGGTTCSVSVGKGGEDSVEILDRQSFCTNEHPLPAQVLKKLADEADKIMKGHNLSAVGISCGGPLNNKTGVILSPPNLPGWRNVAVCDFFEKRWSIPAFLQNDANAGAVAEWMYGAGRGTDNFIFITFGTGFGAGLILDRRLYAGNQGMAGELGHWRISPFGPTGYGKSGSLEGFCSGSGILQQTKQKLLELRQLGLMHPLMNKGKDLSTKDMFDLASEGDELCLEIVSTVGEMLGRGLAMLIDLLNPEVIVAGSIFTRRYDLLHPIAIRTIEKEVLSVSAQHCRILPSELGEEIGDISALATALYSLNTNRRVTK